MDSRVRARYFLLLAIASLGLAIENVTVVLDNPFTLHCTVKNASQVFEGNLPGLLWTKNENLLPNWTGKPIYQIERAQFDDSGVYICNNTVGIEMFDVMVGDTPIARGRRKNLNCPDHNTSSYIVWSKNDEVLVNETGLTYTPIAERFTDGGVYKCNNTGTEAIYTVVVGEKPQKPPMPNCLDSPNTTIWCFSTTADNEAAELSMDIYKRSGLESFGLILSNHDQHEVQLNISVDIDIYHVDGSTAYSVKTTVRNDFGTSSSEKTFYLAKKVIPDPPVNVKMETTGKFTFTGSFDVPDSWITSSTLRFGYTVTNEIGADKKIGQSSSEFSTGTTTVSFSIKVVQDLSPYTLLCMKARIKYYPYNANWGRYSEEVCNYTEEEAPSKGPQNVTVTRDYLKGAQRIISLQWQPPPNESRNGVIVSYTLVINEVATDITVTNVTLPRNKTEWRSDSGTLSLLDPYKEYLIELTAATSKGQSPVTSIPLAALTPTNIVLVVVIIVTCLAGFVLVATIVWKVQRKVNPQDLPEPFLIPENQMNFLLSRDGPLPKETEVFDELRGQPLIDEEGNLEREENTEGGPQKEMHESNGKPSLPIDDGYMRRNSMEVLSKRSDGSFIDAACTEQTSIDITPTQAVTVNFTDTDSSNPYANAEVTCFKKESLNNSGGTAPSHDNKIIPITVTKAESHYIANDDNTLQARSPGGNLYENYIPFEKKVFETMRKLNTNS